MYISRFKNAMTETIAGAVIISMSLYAAFVAFEPVIGVAQVQDQFIISQSITSELSFTLNAADVLMSPAIQGITGGTSNGGTQVRVLTNDTNGYSMTLRASSSAGMIGTNPANVIPYATTSSSSPAFAFSSSTVPPNKAAFAYSVEASSTQDLDPTFRDDGSSCATGSGDTADACWLHASTTDEVIINRSTSTPASGATTTLKFRTVVQPNPSPSLNEDTYTATTTLTATAN
jgi:hypothetical protein